MICLVTGLPWMAYHIINELYLPFLATLLNCGSLLASILKHHYRKAQHKEQDKAATNPRQVTREPWPFTPTSVMTKSTIS